MTLGQGLRMIGRCLVLACGSALVTPAVFGHDLRLTEVTLVLGAEGVVTVAMTCDLDALALGAGGAADDAQLAEHLRSAPAEERAAAVDRLEAMLVRRVRVRADGTPLALTVDLPEAPRPPNAAGPPSYLGTTARFRAALPADAGAVTFSASRAFPPVQLTVVDRRAGRETPVAHELLEQGGESTPYRLDAPPPEPPMGTVLARYGRLGVHHIVPAGLDHMLFVLGLFFFAAGWRALLLQVSAFTVAHTATLALALFHVVRLPGSVVEPLIALSIAWVGVENAWALAPRDERVGQRRRSGRGRLALVFAFGLLHGLGFAGVLESLGLPAGQRVTALIGFNAGVELGQLLVLAAAWLLTAPRRRHPAYRRRVALPASLLVAAAGLYWLVQRVG